MKQSQKMAWIVIAATLIAGGAYWLWAKRVPPVPSGPDMGIATTTKKSPDPRLNPTVSNKADDFDGKNLIDSIAFAWSIDPRAAEYVLFRGDALTGPFTELGRIPAGRSTNAVDPTPDARTKTLCYKLEARDAQGRTIRTYESICVPPWREE